MTNAHFNVPGGGISRILVMELGRERRAFLPRTWGSRPKRKYLSSPDVVCGAFLPEAMSD